MPRTVLACILAGLVAASMVSATAHAQKGRFNKAAAKSHYVAAKRAENKKDWKEAAREYGVAYDIGREAALFYNIGFALMNDGNCEFAIIYFKRFLDEADPKAEIRNKAESFVAGCQKKLGIAPEPTPDPAATRTSAESTGSETTGGPGGAVTAAPAGPDPASTAPADGTAATGIDPVTGLPIGFDESGESEASAALKGAWIALGLAAALGATGTVFAITARERQEDVNDLLAFRDSAGNPGRFEGELAERYRDKVDEGNAYETYSIIAFGAAGAATLAGLGLFIMDALDEGTPEPGPRASLAPTAGGRGVSVTAGWDF